jgi:hypothetical protein
MMAGGNWWRAHEIGDIRAAFGQDIVMASGPPPFL